MQSTAQTLPGSAAQTDRTMFQAEDLGKMRFGEGGAKTKPVAQKAADNFIEPCRKGEALAEAYAKRYPSIDRLGTEWMSYPDLQKLHDDYNKNNDPIAFVHGVARSKNFAKLLVKYAGDPAVQSFIKEGIAPMLGGMTSSAMSLLTEDNSIKTVIANVAGALGLPPALTSGILNGGKVDQNQVMGQILQGNPGLQGAIQDPNMQKAMPPQGASPDDHR